MINLFVKGKRFWDLMDHWIMILCILFLIILTIIIFFQVILRYVFSSPLVWVEEIARFLFIWITFLGSYLALRKEMHFQVKILTNYLPKITIASNLLGILFFGIVLKYSPQTLSVLFGRLSPATNIPFGFIFLVVIFASTMMLIELIRKIYTVLLGLRRDR